jgi:tetratricopeptide (TPR) repeat protein/predicted Ser/Thr protein kinase
MIGELVGQYRIDAQLGAGAMGVVYRAYDTRLHRTVAIKLLQDVSTEESVARLLQEARAASTLNHPHICTVYEVSEIEGHAFIVMEYVDGKPLFELIPSRGLPLERVLDYGSQIADAVAFAHQRGIVHRDLKTSNIVITKEGRAKVLDFGLARRLPADTLNDATQSVPAAPGTTDVAGTPAYMSPEVLRGEPADPQSDVWSLGIILYEMATGERPFDGRTPFQLAATVLSDAPVVVPAHVAPPLAVIIRRSIAKEPTRRYERAGELRAALEAVQPSTIGVQPLQLPRATPVRSAALVLSGITAIVALIVAVVGVDGLRDGLSRLTGEPAIAFAERDWLLVTEFDNQTGDAVFDRGLNTALGAALTQSAYVNVVPANRIAQSLRRMQKTQRTLTDAATARDVAQREGFRMVLTPAIASTGGSYLLAASLIDPTSGITLRSQTVRARTKEDVLGAVDELSSRIRGSLGEASAMIARQTRPLVEATTSSLEALQRFSLGREAHMAQQLDKARGLYEEALRIDPAFTSARLSLGMINAEFFDRAKGVELIAQAMKAADGLTDAERLTVQTFHAMVVERNLAKAADLYRSFLAVHPDAATAHNNLGRVYMQMGRWDEAIAELQQALRLDPDLFLAYFSLNTIYLYEKGDLDRAIETAERQLARDDRSARAYGQLAAAYVGKNDLRQAETAFRRSLDLDPRFVMDWYRLGHVLRLQGRYDEALKAHLHVLELDSRETSARYEAAAVAELAGDQASARTWLRQVAVDAERSLKDSPGSAAVQLDLAAALARLGNVGRADAVLRQRPEWPAGLPVERAGVLVLMDRRDEALAVLETAVRAGYRNWVWLRMQTNLHALQGDSRYEALFK